MESKSPTHESKYREDDSFSREKSPEISKNPHQPRNNFNQSDSKPLIMTEALPDGFHKLEFENGTYMGYLKDNKRNGKGKYIWHDGNEYDGDWVDDLKHGEGVFTWNCGDVYEGHYTKDKREGHGTKTYSNGDSYEVFSSLCLGRMGSRQKGRKRVIQICQRRYL